MMALESNNTEIIKLLEECTRFDRPNKKKKKKKKKGKTSNQNNEDEKPFFTSDIKGKMSRIQDVMEANEELKSKIKEKEGEILQLRTTSEKYAEDLSKDLLSIE